MKYTQIIDNIIDQSNSLSESKKQTLFDYSKQQKEAFDATKDDTKIKLTSLPGLRDFFYFGNELVLENPDKRFAVIVMDISQFKAVNEFCGRNQGDALLKYIATLFKDLEKDRLFTISGHARADNFLLVTAFNEVAELEELTMFLYNSIRSFPLPYKVLPSFGICPSYESSPAVSFLKDCATIALNSIKGKFYAPYCIFNEEMRRSILRDKQIENDIVKALENEELTAFIQPKIDMRTGEIIGGEALVRWNHPTLGPIPPSDFLPVLERNGFIIQLDYYIFESVFKFLSDLKASGKKLVPISVNISRIHMYDSNLEKSFLSMSEKYNIAPEFVPLELTESAILDNPEVIFNKLDNLQNIGFQIHMDDFGTGLSTLQMLTQVPLDEIKIDRSFLTNLDDARNITILKYIIGMLREIEIPFIIEGVETNEQQQMLINFGCHFAQGYHFYKPMTQAEFSDLL